MSCINSSRRARAINLLNLVYNRIYYFFCNCCFLCVIDRFDKITFVEYGSELVCFDTLLVAEM